MFHAKTAALDDKIQENEQLQGTAISALFCNKKIGCNTNEFDGHRILEHAELNLFDLSDALDAHEEEKQAAQGRVMLWIACCWQE